MATVEIDTDEIAVFLKDDLGKKLPKNYNSRRVVTDVANFISARIKIRTLSGKDKFNNPFAPYTEGTKRQRAADGRGIEVDLFDTGKMLGAIGVTGVSDDEATVGIFDAIQQKKAILHQLGGRVTRNRLFGKFVSSFTVDYPRRAFFGVSDADTVTVKGIDKIHQAELDRALKEI